MKTTFKTARLVKRKPWQYRGRWVYPAELNGSGVRWHTIAPTLRADTKTAMRQIIREASK